MEPITVSILRGEHDSTNAGATSAKFGMNRITLIGENDEVPEKFVGQVFRIKHYKEYIYAEPVAKVPEDHIGWMMGGNFCYSPDARFRREVNEYPIAIHDRSEYKSDYETMSR